MDSAQVGGNNLFLEIRSLMLQVGLVWYQLLGLFGYT